MKLLIKQKNSGMEPIDMTSMYFQCAACILFHFVNLHSFADGNGRMYRLLASRCLYLVFLFPCPIYNIYAPTNRGDFLYAIKKARKHFRLNLKPCGKCDIRYGETKSVGHLVAMLIESGWHTAKDMHRCVAINHDQCICN